jgi:antirestriction protein ArdC
MPTATIVHGIKEWNANGRKIRKGEHGIQILAPAGQYEVSTPTTAQGEREGQGEKTQTRQFFRLAYVFDISQTEPV